jgi:hypothetical protein
VSDAADTFAKVHAQVDRFLDELVDTQLFDEWSKEANALYKEQFAKKQNPYGEVWTPRPGDANRKSYYKFGRVIEVERDGFTLEVAGSNANRSCVPFEPRGLGVWRPRFDEIFQKRAQLLFRSVRP